ncbi:hypothetical protein KEJ39_05695 [Candidatus Bathyarchaeota archaeon]|nr:hypothetical protein [Candidatus Bathyarchaeota archaeon]
MKITQTAFAAVLLVALIVMPIYYSWPTPSKAKITAVKLKITIQPISESQISAIVSAVDESGELDTTRDDVVELSFSGTSASELERSRVNLKDGEASVGIKVYLQQSSFLTARWISGPTPLKDATVLVSPLMWNY